MGHSTRRLMMGAAGAGGDPTYVDDVFSTYLYTGTSANQTISNGIKLSNANAGSCVEFDASSSQYLKVPQHSSLELGTGDYCIECWVRPTASGSPNEGIWTYGSYDGNGGMLAWIHGNELKIFCVRTGANICTSNNWRQQNTWTHLAVARYSGTTKTFSNGVEIGTSTEQNNDNVGEAANNQNQFFLGCERSNGNNIGGYFEGNISNMRIVKGSAVYTSNFTPPTNSLTSGTNTVVLFCQSSTSATAATKTPITITSNGNPTANGFGPFTASDGEGGLVWLKSRTQNYDHWLFDTVRGTNFPLRSNLYNAATDVGSTYFNSFNNSGFTVGSNGSTNYTGVDFSSWSFRKSKGFFDIVSWTGNDNGSRQIAHNLGCQPGLIILKNTSRNGTNWMVWHKDIGATEFLELNATSAKSNDPNLFGGSSSTSPTSTNFTIGGGESANKNGDDFIAYLFAGGESTAATARSVHFNGSSGYLNTTSSSSDLTMGTGDFTIECWVSKDAQTHKGIWQISSTSGGMTTSNYGDTIALGYQNGVWQIYGGGTYKNSQSYDITVNEWYHTAYVRSSGVSTLYVNGIPVITQSDTNNYDGTYMVIGAYYNTSYLHNGKISNFRVIKGQALYTSSFRPPTEPLTNITNTKLLCCNNSSTTGSTVTPVTITANGNPTASTDSPFDDPEGFKFGEEGDQNLIKCGSYIGNGSSNGPDINLGWEPQWFIVKNATSGSTNWLLFDSMRGLTDSDQSSEANIKPNSSDAEWDNEYLSPTSRGFRLTNGGSTWVNENNSKFIYIAIRRPDGYVGKPPEAGTDVFSMAYGNSGGTNPSYVSNFPVDFALLRQPATSEAWYTAARLIQIRYLFTNTTGAANTSSNFVFDHNNGWRNGSAVTNYLSWMWKRHAGFDVVTYTGNGSLRTISHSMGRAPEMMWFKKRNASKNWYVYHIGINGGVNPENYSLRLNTTAAEDQDGNTLWNQTVPTSSGFTINTDNGVNNNNDTYIAMLFASVDGISKVGYYTGTANTQTITTGFQPRMMFLKNITDSGYYWQMVDTTRGWTSSSNKRMYFNDPRAQDDNSVIGEPLSTGFTITGTNVGWNKSGSTYIYYAHA